MHRNREKSVALMKTVFVRDICFSEGLSHHYRIQHSRDRICGNEEMKRGKNVLRKLKAAERLNKIEILS